MSMPTCRKTRSRRCAPPSPRGAISTPTSATAISAARSMRLARTFHDLGQHPAHVLGVKEEDRGAVRADPRWTEDSRTLALEMRARRRDVGDLEADMMLTAGRILLEEPGDRRVR